MLSKGLVFVLNGQIVQEQTGLEQSTCSFAMVRYSPNSEDWVKIGVPYYRLDYYTNKRNIVGILPEANYVPVRDLFSYRRALALRLNRLIGKPLIPTFDLNNQFDDFDLNKVDLFHFSNGISYGKTAWFTSFETIVPRFSKLVTRHQGDTSQSLLLDSMTKRGLEALADKPCKGIIAWSKNSKTIEEDLLAQFPGDYAAAILPKLAVLHPPQEVIVSYREERHYDHSRPMRFILVGAAFFRKGGRELLNAFERLAVERGLPVKLVVVSSLRLEPYAAHETEEDLNWAKEKLNSGADWIEYYPSLPNPEVIELQKRADVGLLPTWADTYGLSVLESQACGCPVISTDIRALPEMNNDKVGWLIKVPKNQLGEALYTRPDQRMELSKTIEIGLEETVRGIIANPAIVAAKGNAAIAKIRTDHDPQRYAESLRQLYSRA